MPGTQAKTQDPRRVLWFTLTTACFLVLLSVTYSSLIKPIFISMLLSYLFLPAVKWCEAKGCRRRLAAISVVTILVLLGAFAVARFIPISYSKGLNILSMAPVAVSRVESHWVPFAQEFADGFGFGEVIDVQAAFEEVNFVEEIRMRFQAGLVGIWSTGTSFLGGVLNVALIPVITYFLIVERVGIGRGGGIGQNVWGCLPEVSGVMV